MIVKLFINLADKTSKNRRIEVDSSPFSIGRTAENNLVVANGALSRKHAEIIRFENIFVLSDTGSSNGTEVNGEALTKPVVLKNGDKILFGGAVEATVELENAAAAIAGDDDKLTAASAATNASSINPTNASAADVAADVSNSSWKAVVIFAPILGLVVLILAIGLMFALGRKSDKSVVAETDHEAVEVNNSRRSVRDAEGNINNANDSLDQSNETRATGKNVNASSLANGVPLASNKVSDELDRVERNALIFLRSISNDVNPVLTSEQIALINTKIKALKNSAVTRGNIKAAKRAQLAFEKIGVQHNLKPAFLAAAACAKLNDSASEPAVIATAMAADLNKYAIVLGTELANDSLLTVAAYAEGETPNTIRDRIANLTKNTPDASAATIRTIWFLREHERLSAKSFDFVVRFIAIGTIMQETEERTN